MVLCHSHTVPLPLKACSALGGLDAICIAKLKPKKNPNFEVVAVLKSFASPSRNVELSNVNRLRGLNCKAEMEVDIGSSCTSIVQVPHSAADVVKEFYSSLNSHQLHLVEQLIADNCVYEDLIFSKPFVGRKSIMEFFKKFTDTLGTDLQVVIDDISSEDMTAVGVTWHLEWRRKEFPFSKGCSFYRCEIFGGQRKIIYARDIVEAPTKLGDTALVAIKAVTLLLEKFPQIADRF